MGNITISEVKKDHYVRVFLGAADNNFAAIGYKEHGLRHAKLASNIAGNVLTYLNFSKRDVWLTNVKKSFWKYGIILFPRLIRWK